MDGGEQGVVVVLSGCPGYHPHPCGNLGALRRGARATHYCVGAPHRVAPRQGEYAFPPMATGAPPPILRSARHREMGHASVRHAAPGRHRRGSSGGAWPHPVPDPHRRARVVRAVGVRGERHGDSSWRGGPGLRAPRSPHLRLLRNGCDGYRRTRPSDPPDRRDDRGDGRQETLGVTPRTVVRSSLNLPGRGVQDAIDQAVDRPLCRLASSLQAKEVSRWAR
jgi:hypothetical protein